MENIEELEHAHPNPKKEVIKVTVILSVVTIIELILGYMMMSWDEASFARHFVKGIIIILMLLKAYYIVGYFMHLKHENGILKKLILIPLTIFIWFIIAFLADGHSYLNLRNKYDPYSVEMNKKVQPNQEERHNTQVEE